MEKSLILIFSLMAVMLLPSTAQAAVEVGDIAKCPQVNSVYHIGEDGKRYAFPNSRVFHSWHKNFDKVKTLECGELGKLKYGGNIRYRAGAKLIKTTFSPTIYAVETDGTLRPITDPKKAVALYGEDWFKLVEDVPELFFFDYKVGEKIDEDELPEGFLLSDEDGSLLQVDENGDAIEIDDVVKETEEENLLREFSRPFAKVKAHLKKILKRKHALKDLSEEERKELLEKFKAIRVEKAQRIKEIRLDEKDEDEKMQINAKRAINQAANSIERATLKLRNLHKEGHDITKGKRKLIYAVATLKKAERLYKNEYYFRAKVHAKLAIRLAHASVTGLNIDNDGKDLEKEFENSEVEDTDTQEAEEVVEDELTN